MSMTTTSHSRPMPMLLAVAIGLALIANSAAAQEMDHSKMNMPMPKPAVKKKPVAVKKPAASTSVRKAVPKQAPVKKKRAAAPKASMDHSTMPMPADDKSMQGMDHSTMPMPADDKSMQGMDHSSMPMPADDKSMQGMDHSSMPMPVDDKSMQGMDHSSMPMPVDDKSMQGMDHSAMPGMTMAPTEPREPIPVLTAADRAGAVPPAGGHTVHDNSIQSFMLVDRLEVWNADAGKPAGLQWEGQGWVGTDLNRLWLRSEGERVGRTESADLEVLYGRSIATWWDVVVGLRHDFKPGPSQDFAAFGVIGLAPYKYEVEATAYVGQGGQTSARLEAEYDILLTNRLILQPLVEVNLYGQNDERRGIGSGLSTAELGFRLRYEIIREFAPYIGIVRERAFGRTADFRRTDGEHIDDTHLIVGLRFWF